MPQVKRSDEAGELAKLIGERFIALSEESKVSFAEAARMMQYANATTLTKIKTGESMPDASRLALLAAELSSRLGRSPNLHWLITGEGPEWLDGRQSPPRKPRANLPQQESKLVQLVKQMPLAQQKALLLLLERS